MNVRTRISPSPSGNSIHIGNLKTAIFNYVFAKKHAGVFYYRVEDTDQKRAVDGAAENILRDLRWAGVAPTEGYLIGGPHGPYSQMERLGEYRKYVDHLLEKGFAYRCYCSERELNAKREEASKINPKAPFKYPGTCRNITKDMNKPFVIRFRTPTEGVIEYDDMVFGHRIAPNKENYDFVIARESGVVLYNAACVFDDISHRTTHIIRGADHLKNCPSQIMIYQALGANIPKMAHLTMLLNSEGGKLSKRDNSVSVSDYMQAGFSPKALCNYLLRFGWSDGNREVFSLEDIVDAFDFDRCGKADGKFDAKKLASIQYSHLKSTSLTPTSEYIRHTIPFLKDNGIDASYDEIAAAIPIVRERAKTFVDAAKELAPILQRGNIAMDADAAAKFLTSDNKPHLQRLHEFFSSVEEWNVDSLKDKTTSWLTSNNLTIKDVGQLLRVALVGRTQSPELFGVMGILGKDRTLQRIKDAI